MLQGISRATRFLAAACLLLAGCATQRPAYHAFDFRPLSDSPGVKVLDWRYDGQRPLPWELKQATTTDRGLAGASITAIMPVPESIYVKWQVPPDQQVHEATIQLRDKLPFSMQGKEIVLIFRRNVPHVFLISTEPRPCRGQECTTYLSSDVAQYARSYLHGVVRQLYPDTK